MGARSRDLSFRMLFLPTHPASTAKVGRAILRTSPFGLTGRHAIVCIDAG